MRMRWIAATALLISQTGWSATWHDHQDIIQRAEAMLLEQAATLPGRPSIDIVPIDERLHLAPCQELSLQRLGNSNSYAAQTIAVQCKAPKVWNLYLQAKLRLMQPVPVAVRSLSANKTIDASDIVVVEKDIASLPPGTLTDSSQVIGQELSSPVMAGVVLRKDMIKQKPMVLQGQQVKLVAMDTGLRLTADGIALQNGKVGQQIPVRNRKSGTVIQAVVQESGECRVYF